MPDRPASSLTARALWLMAAKTVGFAIGIALPLFLTRALDQTQFGIYKQVFLVLSTANTLLPLGFHMSAFYFLGREPERRREFVFNILAFQALMASLGALALAMFPVILDSIFHSQQITSYRYAIAAMVLTWVTSSFLESISVANQETHLSALLITGANCSRVVLLLVAGVWFRTVEAMIFAAIVHGALQTIALLLYLQMRFPGFWHAWNFATARRQFAYAIPFSFSGLFYYIQADLPSYVVSHLYGPALFATYAIGCFQLPYVNILTEATSSVLIPRVSMLQREGRPGEILRLMVEAARKLALPLFPTYAFLMAVGPDLLAFLFSEPYRQAWPVFAINLTILPFMVLLLDPIQRAYAEHRKYFLGLQAGALVVQSIGLWMLAPRFALVGAISAFVATQLMARLLIARKAAAILRCKSSDYAPFQALLPIASAAAAAGALAWITRSLLAGHRPFAILCASGAVFVSCYGLLLYLLRALSLEERRLLSRQLARFTKPVSLRKTA